MARGWESKSVEEQINAREDSSSLTPKSVRTPVERERLAKRESLLLARTRTLSAIECARDQRYRLQLEKALAHLDDQIGRLGRIGRS